MPSINNIGVLNVNTPQTNSSVIVGESVVTGMNANSKSNGAQGGSYGFYNIMFGIVNINLDNLDFADGNINDQDLSPNIGGTV